MAHLKNRTLPSRPNTLKWISSCVSILILAATISLVGIVFLQRWLNPPLTWLMVDRYYLGDSTQLKPIKWQWVDVENISPHAIKAAIAAEDNLFLTHNGFDIESIRMAHKDIKSGKRFRGASTISMQVAKNVHLWHDRTWTRKAIEAGFTILIEAFWGKQRIIEVYLNVAEFGPSVYGIEAASNLYFKKSANDLTKNEAAMLMTTLPNPLKRNPAVPSKYMKNYQQRILKNMKNIGELKF